MQQIIQLPHLARRQPLEQAQLAQLVKTRLIVRRVEEFERQLLEKAMARSNGVIAKAAKMLGLSYKTMQYRLEKFQLGRGAASRMQPEGLEEQNQHGG